MKKSGRRAPMANPVRLSQPGEMDILCGKDRACALHKGSQRFRAVIDSYRARYQKATTKYDKMQITKEIYEVLSQKSRFLKYVAEDRAWEEITPLAGRDKIGHALRFANNNQPKTIKKKSKKALLKRQGSFSSVEGDDSESSIAGAAENAAAKADLVASLVEVAKEEPKVWNSVVDHLTLQDVLTSVPDSATSNGHDYSDQDVEEAMAHQAVANAITDPLALENIAYAVDTKTDDAALDELITLLNNDEIDTEDVQDILAMAHGTSGVEVAPPSVTFAVKHTEHVQADPTTSSEMMPPLVPAATYPVVAQHHRRRSSAGSIMWQMHKRGLSADDDMWSVMQEPLLDLDWR